MNKVLVFILMILLVVPVHAHMKDTAIGRRFIRDYKHYPDHKGTSYEGIIIGTVFIPLGIYLVHRGTSENYTYTNSPSHGPSTIRDPNANPYAVGGGVLMVFTGALFTYLGCHHLHKVHLIDNGIAIPIPIKRKVKH